MHTYARTRTRTGIFRRQFLDSSVIFRRTGIFRRQFLDSAVIFRRQFLDAPEIFILSIPIGIFRCTRNFQTTKT